MVRCETWADALVEIEGYWKVGLETVNGAVEVRVDALREEVSAASPSAQQDPQLRGLIDSLEKKVEELPSQLLDTLPARVEEQVAEYQVA